ncbi:MAG: 6-phosphogluconolactonase, partial [Methylococcaceae bacterium]|nr:6-phosphogluconolactonase [Methylococcaceae bacterium]
MEQPRPGPRQQRGLAHRLSHRHRRPGGNRPQRLGLQREVLFRSRPARRGLRLRLLIAEGIAVESTNWLDNVFVLPDPDGVAQAAAEHAVALFSQLPGKISLALSGGSTPQRFYRLLADEPYRSRIPWDRLHLFVVDERHVPFDHPDSNYGMIASALLDRVPIPAANRHPMPTDGDPEDCARRYRAELAAFFGGTERFDLVVLGMGPDGHTASLFPGRSPSTPHSVEAVYDSPKPPPTRLTLTLPVLNRAAEVLFLVTGADKAPALARVLAEGADGGLPAGWIAPERG